MQNISSKLQVFLQKMPLCFLGQGDVSSCQMGFGLKSSLGGACKLKNWRTRDFAHTPPPPWACLACSWRGHEPHFPCPWAGGDGCGGHGGRPPHVPADFRGIADNVISMMPFFVELPWQHACATWMVFVTQCCVWAVGDSKLAAWASLHGADPCVGGGCGFVCVLNFVFH